MAAAKRTDPHRPGAIIPANYEYVFSYNLSTTVDGWPVPSQGVTCELDGRTDGYRDAAGAPCAHKRTVTGACSEGCEYWVKNGSHAADGECCCIEVARDAHARGMDVFGAPGKCGVCGAHFIYGDVWRHVDGDYVHLGHDCAAKYSMLADRSAHELALGRLRQAAAVACERARKAEARAEFLARHEGLEAALATDHPIVRDIAVRFTQFTTLSDKQVALVLKLAREAAEPKVEERHSPAPTGRTTFRGVVVSCKSQESAYGTQMRMTVKVTTDDGSTWLAWGTAPAGLLGDAAGPLRGCEVEVTATLKPGRDPHFALMTRPRGVLLRDPLKEQRAEESRVRDMVVSICTFLLAAAHEARSEF